MTATSEPQGNVVTGDHVASFFGRDDDEEFIDQAEKHVRLVELFVRSYTRGQGFDLGGLPGVIEDDLCAVIVTTAARLVTNPEQVERASIGDFNVAHGKGFQGFTLPELAVLHNYRRRTA